MRSKLCQVVSLDLSDPRAKFLEIVDNLRGRSSYVCLRPQKGVQRSLRHVSTQ